MKIRIAILEKDLIYLKRFASSFTSKYSDKVEIYSFSDYDLAISNLESSKIDVFLACDSFNIDMERIPQRCAFGYLVELSDVDMLNEQKAIFKFQKIDLIYREILNIFSEKESMISGFKTDKNGGKILMFTSVSGGTGTSTVAASCAICFGALGKKVFYLNLEEFGSSDVFFSSEGQYCMSDVIYNLKSKKSSLPIKIESIIKQDNRHVDFFSQPKTALDLLELDVADILLLIDMLISVCGYEYIIIDMPLKIDKNYLDVYKVIDDFVIVGDGSEISNLKIINAYNALQIKEQEWGISLTKKMSVIYNKFDNKTSNVINISDFRNIGGITQYKQATSQQILSQISNMAMFKMLM